LPLLYPFGSQQVPGGWPAIPNWQKSVARIGLSNRKSGMLWSKFWCWYSKRDIPWWLAHSSAAVQSVSRLSISSGTSTPLLNANEAPHGMLPDRL